MANVLIACEFSGITRNAFASLGHNAVSCDFLPSELPGNHYQGDVLDVINEGWDLMIAHPPCTYLSYAGNAYFNLPGRSQMRIDALQFFNKLLNAPIKFICVENPQGIIDKVIRKHDQIIHPYYFGEKHLKRTCLWLKNLPLLYYTLQPNLFSEPTACDKPNPIYIDKSGKKRYYVDSIKGGSNGIQLRNKSFQSIAAAMAAQWSHLI
jgi:site-specific DNA-cytosine methylase